MLRNAQKCKYLGTTKIKEKNQNAQQRSNKIVSWPTKTNMCNSRKSDDDAIWRTHLNHVDHSDDIDHGPTHRGDR